MPQSKLADFLGLTDEQLEEAGIDEDLLQEDSGSSGEMVYSYYFNVPDETPEDILEEKGWSVGERIEVPIWLFNEPDAPEEE
ncbi:hypothetical protein [Pantoea dispersa]|uniref:hypothetical protein n=1 Tax=Pantoea dispersa TaxID=59814 RepID=UPI001EE7037C|nr:hypothetical protein [Pantoea dispersa]UKY38200.1 hypothetical protein KFZ74_09095 [Pantoea dispersa]